MGVLNEDNSSVRTAIETDWADDSGNGPPSLAALPLLNCKMMLQIGTSRDATTTSIANSQPITGYVTRTRQPLGHGT